MPLRTISTQSPFCNLMLTDPEFFLEYVSVHFPFSHADLDIYWNVLPHGDAFYDVYIADTEVIHSPRLGLCYNQNIRWTEEMKRNWRPGFDNPYLGAMVGTGRDPIDYDDDKALYSIMPLNLDRRRLSSHI